MADVAISWYHSSICCAGTDIVPGDSHGPYGPRNDKVGSAVHEKGRVERPSPTEFLYL